MLQRVLSEDPPTVEVDVAGLDGGLLDQRQMYIRSNLPVPMEPSTGFDLALPGRSVRTVNIEELLSLRQVSIDMVLECAGNGRSLMNPVPAGVAWTVGGVSPITVGGVLLTDVIGPIPGDIVELVFTGADGFEFSIDRQLLDSRRPMLATHIDDEHLDLSHGAAVRLVVPGHYAMKSVKWLTRIEGVMTPFQGEFVEKYRYYQDEKRPEGAPVAEIVVRSVVSTPVEGDSFSAGPIEVRGSAWSGNGEIEEVELSGDGGDSWQVAHMVPRKTAGRFAAVGWATTLDVVAGDTVVMSRATDSSGDIQPLWPRWNRNGYANNVVHRVNIRVE